MEVINHLMCAVLLLCKTGKRETEKYRGELLRAKEAAEQVAEITPQLQELFREVFNCWDVFSYISHVPLWRDKSCPSMKFGKEHLKEGLNLLIKVLACVWLCQWCKPHMKIKASQPFLCRCQIQLKTWRKKFTTHWQRQMLFSVTILVFWRNLSGGVSRSSILPLTTRIILFKISFSFFVAKPVYCRCSCFLMLAVLVYSLGVILFGSFVNTDC